MESTITEYDLLVRFKEAKEKLEQLKLQTSEAQKEFDEAENKLLELMSAQGKDATAKYEGLGYVSVTKPMVYASCVKDNEGQLFEYLKKDGRSDLIKEAVNARSLSGYVKELIEQGNPIPEFINYYLKPGLRFYAK